MSVQCEGLHDSINIEIGTGWLCAKKCQPTKQKQNKKTKEKIKTMARGKNQPI